MWIFYHSFSNVFGRIIYQKLDLDKDFNPIQLTFIIIRRTIDLIPYPHIFKSITMMI